MPVNSQILTPEAPSALLAEIAPQDMELLANTGELSLAVPLHDNNGDHALHLALSFYPMEERSTQLPDLGSAPRAMVTQCLVRQPNGHRITAAKIMVNSPWGAP